MMSFARSPLSLYHTLLRLPTTDTGLPQQEHNAISALLTKNAGSRLLLNQRIFCYNDHSWWMRRPGRSKLWRQCFIRKGTSFPFSKITILVIISVNPRTAYTSSYWALYVSSNMTNKGQPLSVTTVYINIIEKQTYLTGHLRYFFVLY